MHSRLSALVVALVVGLGCDRAETSVREAPGRSEVEPPLEANAEPEPEQVSPDPVPAPPVPSFDPATAEAARVRILVAHSDHWTACGRVHSVGALEVEVLGVGEPAPRMVLFVSCPADIGRKRLMVGEVLDVELHRRRQPWPKPRVELPEGVPIRYVSGLGSDLGAVL